MSIALAGSRTVSPLLSAIAGVSASRWLQTPAHAAKRLSGRTLGSVPEVSQDDHMKHFLFRTSLAVVVVLVLLGLLLKFPPLYER
jgi:hypothetical protein